MDVFDASQRYISDGRRMIILAGKEYGSGSSRDWAAKGPWMLVSVSILTNDVQIQLYFYVVM